VRIAAGLAVLAAVPMALLAATGVRAERLTIAVSTPAVQITSNFSGVAVTVFGVIEGGSDQVFLEGGYDAAVTVTGPPQTVVERRKDRVFGIWANQAAEKLIAAPSFYALDSSKPPTALAPKAVLARLAIGFDNLPLSTGAGGENGLAPPAAEFRDAFIRLQTQAGLFTEGTGLQFIGDTIFRSNTFLPANIPEGKYTVLAYLFSGQSLVAAAESSFTVSKIGLEQTVASFAAGQPLIYGVLCVALAIFAGWLGGVIFRRD
jgi:uncharacterized protein (TIGR02186 family)